MNTQAIDSASELLQRLGLRVSEQWISAPDSLTDMRIDLSRMTDEEIIDRADDALDGDLHPSGVRPLITNGGRIDWAANPAQNREWLLMIHRHAWWPLWGAAYQRTGDEKYARAFVSQLGDWIDRNPMPRQESEHLESWRLMEVGLRMRVSWIPAFACFFPSPEFSDNAKLKMLRAIYDHAQFLCHFHTNRNHLVRESNGLIAVGLCFPEFSASQDWLEKGLGRLDRELQDQVSADGTHIEMSVGYQWLSIDEFEVTRSLLKQFGLKLPKSDLDEILHKMYGFLASVIRPNLSFPQLNDGFILWDAQRLAEAARISGWEGIEYCASGGESGSSPSYCSRSFPNAGLHVMRSGWTSDACYLICDTGPYGGPHGHEDKLSFELHAYGAPFIVDPGSYTYDKRDEYRNYFVGSQGHNTVLVDGQSQVRRWDTQNLTPVVQDVGHGHWHCDEGFDFASGIYDDGYAVFSILRPVDAAVEFDVTHRRDFVFVRPDYWIVVDYLDGDRQHDFSFLFHLEPEVSVEDRTGNSALLRSGHNDARLIMQAVMADPMDSQVVAGQESPIQGWYSEDHHKKRPSPTLIFETRESRSAFVAWVLYPLRPEHNAGQCHVKLVTEPTSSQLAFEVHASGKVDTVSIENNANSQSSDVPGTTPKITIQRDGKGKFRSAQIYPSGNLYT